MTIRDIFTVLDMAVILLWSQVTVVCFVLPIRGTDLMMHPDLQIDVGFLGPLLSTKVEQELLDT